MRVNMMSVVVGALGTVKKDRKKCERNWRSEKESRPF